MISYREKQLLAVMKYMQNQINDLANDLADALKDTEAGEKISIRNQQYSPLENYEELCARAAEAGYDTFIRAEDILSAEEIEDLDRRREDIDKEFKSLTKLQDKDYIFLFSAVGLQLIKQVLFKLDLSSHDIGAADADNAYELKYDYPELVDGTKPAKRYYAPFQQIANTKTVPYDIVKNTKFFGDKNKETGLGLSGSNHRFKSVGHDPIMGLLFGTANILTNTATFYMDPNKMHSSNARYLNKLRMATFHVRYKDMSFYKTPYIASFASTTLIFDKVAQRIKNDRGAVYAAFVKEVDHIKSDKESIAGIPLPFISLILGSDKTQELAFKGLDWDHFIKNAAVIGKQAGITLTINVLVSMLHRLYLLWDRLKDESSLPDATKLYFTSRLPDFDNIRTRKIVMCSDAIASSVNLVACVGGGLASTYFAQPKLAKQFISHLDIGGIMITIGTLLKDSQYLLKIKDDFIKSKINEDFQHRLSEISNV